MAKSRRAEYKKTAIALAKPAGRPRKRRRLVPPARRKANQNFGIGTVLDPRWRKIL